MGINIHFAYFAPKQEVMEIAKVISGERVASKSAAADETKELRRAILEGEISPLPYFVAAKYVEEVFDSLTKDEAVKEIATSEIESYGRGGFQFNGARVEAVNRSEYDYSNTPKWVELEAQIKQLRALQKAIEDAAKAIPDRLAATMIVTEDGEEIVVNKPLRKTSTIIKTTLPK
ncbi:MAG: hypothetical protein NZ519_05080 [Bacteroidia bacterium]|nr:hypothetical protein [Bacteroidia bacterium]